MGLPVVRASPELGNSLQRGHPWIYRNRIAGDPRLPSGTWVQVQCDRFCAFGLWDAKSPIAVRLFSWSSVPDSTWFRERVREAWMLREPLRAARLTAYRWLYGEGDGVPGVVVDLYNDYAVIETYADSVRAVTDWVVEGLRACTKLKGVLLRDEGINVLWGRPAPREVIVEENGLRLSVDLVAGQKTGLYLDHRDNRRYLEGWCHGKRVLNCFAYTGAFSLYAHRGGAVEVVSIDIAAQAVEQIERNLELNGFAVDRHSLVVADCFELLPQYAAQGQRFDLIILDPPSLAHARRSRHAALRAYVRLNRAAIQCLGADGLLATASCTSQVAPDAFREVLGEAAAQAGKRLLVLHEAGHALDHPVPAQFPEGRYLKFVLGRIGNPA